MIKKQPVPVCPMPRKTTPFLLGVTLPELLVTLAIACLLMMILSNWVLYLYRQQEQRQQQLQLQQAVHSALQLMSKDLRRSGYHFPKSQHNLSLFQWQKRSLTLNLPKQDYYQCAMFFYDLNKDGCIGNQNSNTACTMGAQNNSQNIQKELFGYRLAAGNLEMLFMFAGTINENCTTANCQRHINNPSCYSKGWSKFFDQRYMVRELSFRWLAEQRGLSISLTVSLRSEPTLSYQATALVPLLNEVAE